MKHLFGDDSLVVKIFAFSFLLGASLIYILLSERKERKDYTAKKKDITEVDPAIQKMAKFIANADYPTQLDKMYIETAQFRSDFTGVISEDDLNGHIEYIEGLAKVKRLQLLKEMPAFKNASTVSTV